MDESVEGQGGAYQARYEAAVEAGRAPLMKARAVLECAIFTLIHYNQAAEEQPVEVGDFAMVGEIIRDLVREALDKLDAVNLMRAASGHQDME